MKHAEEPGSAQYDDSDRYHSWFTGFAPYDNPQIAVCVILEGVILVCQVHGSSKSCV
ncbi:MAG: penicillin-binding transpeptidase domain-containing protein [Lachnospira eligens]